MAWNVLFVFFCTFSVSSMGSYYQPMRGSPVWGYFAPPLLHRDPPLSRQTPMEAMVDLTNSLGVAILQDNTFSRGNFAFSPYGVASVLVVLYEGARGESARQIHRAVGFPSDKDIIRIGFRDVHRHLRSYFSHEGYLSGISLNKETSSLKPEYKKILRFYGYDIDLNPSMDDEDDDGTSLGKPATSRPAVNGANKTAVSTTPSTTENPGVTVSGSSSQNPLDLDEVNLTTVATMISTTVDTTNNSSTTIGTVDNATTVAAVENTTTVATENTSPATTESATVATTAGNTAVELTTAVPAVTTDGSSNEISTTARPAEQSTNLPTDAAESVQTSTGVSTDDNPPTENPTEQDTTFPTVVNMPSSNEPTVGSVTHKPDTSTTEAIKTTTVLNLTTELETENVTTTTEPPITDVENNSTCKETKGGCSTTEENTTENSTEDPEFSSETPETVSSSAAGSVVDSATETTTGERTTVKEEETTTEPAKVEKVTNSNLDNGMLIPQSDDVATAAAEKSSTILSATTTAGSSSENSEKTTDSFGEGVNLLSEGRRRMGNKNVIKMSGRIPNLEQEKRIRNIVDTRVPLWLEEKKKTRKIRTITDYLKSPRSPDLSLQLQNGMYDTHVSRNAELYRSLPRLLFLVDGAIDTPVPMMTYTNVFPYAYIPKLHSKALEFPLDDTRYKLLILLPIERRGLRQLIYDLLDYPLSNVLDALKPARVRAMVPTFMVEGFVILTSSLQKLGIWDVFDPRKANLSGMSTDPELYVRNVEQSVTVVIRNYVEILDIQTRTMAARHMEYEFEATHPFVYFVLDTSTNVALMAGQILDPLNSRIY